MALFTSILAFAGSATNALATAAAPNARRDFSTSGSGALDGLRAAAEATINKQRMRLVRAASSCRAAIWQSAQITVAKTGVQRTL